MEIIPAIDIIEGACVRLTKGDYGTKRIYNQDPLETAKRYEGAGIRRLHLVDLDGAESGGIRNYRVLERIAGHTSLIIDFGGGVKQDEDIRIAFENGAAMVTGGSTAVKSPERFLSWLERYGAERIILGADAKDRRISVSGWQEDAGADIRDFVRSYLQKGIRKVISTDIGRDGMLQGAAVDLYRELLNDAEENDLPLYLIASGGVSGEEDLEELAAAGLHGVIIGKAIYEGKISLDTLSRWAEKALNSEMN